MTVHILIFYRLDALLDTQPTVSKQSLLMWISLRSWALFVHIVWNAHVSVCWQLWEADQWNVHGRDSPAGDCAVYISRLLVQQSALKRTQHSASFLYEIRVGNWEVLPPFCSASSSVQTCFGAASIFPFSAILFHSRKGRCLTYCRNFWFLLLKLATDVHVFSL